MVQKGTYTEFLKSGVDFGSLLKKENEEAEPSPVPGTPTLRNRTFSEASIWSQQSSRPSLKDGVPDAQDVSSSRVTWFFSALTDLVILLVSSAGGNCICPGVRPVTLRCYEMSLVRMKLPIG